MIRTITNSLKALLGAGAFMITATSAIAQTNGGPDTYGYVWRDSNDPNGPAYNWIDIANAPGAIQVAGLADDNIKGPFAIGFSFHYYWYDVTTFRVGSNGYMGFSATPVAHPFPTIPLPTGIQNYMAAMACDLTFTDAAGANIPGVEAWYWTSPGNDTLILSYINVPFWDQAAGYTGSNTFQIILSNTDSSITYQYLAQIGVYNNPGNFVTVGIENNSGNIGLQHSHDVFPPSQYAIKFYYPSTTTFQVSDASTTFNNNETTGGLFLPAGGTPYTMTTQIRNTGNQPLAAFNVASRVVNSLNQNQVLSTVQSSALAPGAIEDITFPATFTPVTPGTYRHINNTQLIGDATPSNNEKQLELQVVDTTQASILLSFDTGVDAGLGGLSWSGGGGGAGMEFVPPFYPCNVTQARVFIAANANLFGFSVLVMDDDGVDGTPLTVLDSVFVSSNNVITGAWNTVTFTTPVTISSGSFYLAWMMGGDGISIGQNQIAPVSNRTFEVLGQASNPGSWAAYRYRELEDIMINAYITTVPVGISEVNNNDAVGAVYPNPSSELSYINYSFPNKAKEVLFSIYDVNGKLVYEEVKGNYVSSGTIEIDITQLQNGIYNCVLTNGNDRYVRKLTVIK